MGKDDREMDTLALSAFESHVGSVFKLAADTDSEIDLILISATRMPTTDPPGTSDTGRPFSLLFRGPEAQPFGQGTQTLSHLTMGRLEIFLVPIQPDAEGPLYEAVFA